jgi:hypothetical protein
MELKIHFIYLVYSAKRIQDFTVQECERQTFEVRLKEHPGSAGNPLPAPPNPGSSDFPAAFIYWGIQESGLLSSGVRIFLFRSQAFLINGQCPLVQKSGFPC